MLPRMALLLRKTLSAASDSACVPISRVQDGLPAAPGLCAKTSTVFMMSSMSLGVVLDLAKFVMEDVGAATSRRDAPRAGGTSRRRASRAAPRGVSAAATASAARASAEGRSGTGAADVRNMPQGGSAEAL